MTALSPLLKTAQTGDLIIENYKTAGTQAYHVTLFIRAQHAPIQAAQGTSSSQAAASSQSASSSQAAASSQSASSSQAAASSESEGNTIIHAQDPQVAIAPLSYFDSAEPPFLFAQPTARNIYVGEVAKVFASTIPNAKPATPYGGYPTKVEVNRLAGHSDYLKPKASRFSAMMETRNVGDIPFEIASLMRLFKWTKRYLAAETLSKNRGVTCAMFASICHQVADLYGYLIAQGKDDYEIGTSLDRSLEILERMVNPKADNRKKMTALVTKNGTPLQSNTTKDDKTIYQNHGFRENSNRTLKSDQIEKLKISTSKAASAASGSSSSAASSSAPESTNPEVEAVWLLLQTKVFDIPKEKTRPLYQIIDPVFFYDVKYINSRVLAESITASQGTWRHEICFSLNKK